MQVVATSNFPLRAGLLIRDRNRMDLDAGCLLPMGKHVQFNAYYEPENNTGKRPNQQQHGVGLALNLYFSRKPHPQSTPGRP